MNDFDLRTGEDVIIFDTDFCEGQTEVRNVRIVPFDHILEYYRSHVFDKEDYE